MTQLSKKSKDLQKRMTRLEKELENAEMKLMDQQEVVDKKKQELERVNTEFVSQLLVDNNLNIKDLPNLLSKLTDNSTNQQIDKENKATNESSTSQQNMPTNGSSTY